MREYLFGLITGLATGISVGVFISSRLWRSRIGLVLVPCDNPKCTELYPGEILRFPQTKIGQGTDNILTEPRAVEPVLQKEETPLKQPQPEEEPQPEQPEEQHNSER